MKCPICGCKMKEEFMCPYCKITGEQVKNASNKEAKTRIKKRDTKEVYSSSYMPKDVNRTRLWLVNLFGGFLGLHQFYVGKWKWGLYSILSFVYVLIFHALSFYIYKDSVVLSYFADFGYAIYAVVVYVWISDFFKIMFKKFSMPVVLAEPEFRTKGGKRK